MKKILPILTIVSFSSFAYEYKFPKKVICTANEIYTITLNLGPSLPVRKITTDNDLHEARKSKNYGLIQLQDKMGTIYDFKRDEAFAFLTVGSKNEKKPILEVGSGYDPQTRKVDDRFSFHYDVGKKEGFINTGGYKADIEKCNLK